MPPEVVGLGLLEAAYEAPLDPEGWAPFLRRLRAELGASALGVTSRAEDGSWIEQTWLGLDEAYERAYLQHFHRLDPWVQGAAGLAAGATVRGCDLVPDDRFQRSEFFHDLCRPHRLSDFLGAIVERSPEVGLVSIGLLRSPGERRFGEEERRALEALVPHLRRVFRLQDALRTARAAPLDGGPGLDDLAIPALTVDARMRVLRANRAAHRLLAEGDGLLSRHAVLRTHDAADAAQLTRAVVAAARSWSDGAAPCVVPVRRPAGRRPHTVVVLPERRDAVRLGDANLYVVQPDGSLPSAALLRRAYGLTIAEARLAAAIAAGLSTREVAEQLGISRNTVRSQLRSVFAKTGTDRQATLARLLVSLGAIPEGELPYSGGATSIARR